MNSGNSVKTGLFLLLVAGTCAARSQETVLYSFSEANGGGASPAAGLVIDSKGNLYGTTENGGTAQGGAVFELSKGPQGIWTQKVLHSFAKNSSDGNSPRSHLELDKEGNLYGTTPFGGKNNEGTVFELAPQAGGNWKETVIYNFGQNSSDAIEPSGGVILDSNGNLYGGSSGGLAGLGAIFKLTPGTGGTWSEQVIFSFSDSTTQGSYPSGELAFDSQGNLYGTASEGGAHNFGAVFELSPQAGETWQQSVLYNFGDADQDGVTPSAGLIFDREGNLYGTTYGGGKNCPAGNEINCGTVFELSPSSASSWAETILHSFGHFSADAAVPSGPVAMDREGNLYGLAAFIGSSDAGAVYEVARPSSGTWTEKVLHSFSTTGAGGMFPYGGLAFDSSGNVYGTTAAGGMYGAGTVFEIANPDVAAIPQFSVLGGTYASPQTVTITDYTTGAAIYYTTNGDDPTTDSTRYDGPIRVTENETIKAIAVAEGLSDSAIVTIEYRIAAAVPGFSLKSGTYDKAQTVTITDKTAHATTYYTTNGDNPTNSSLRYSAPIRVDSTETIKAIAVAPEHAPSAVADATYTINPPTAVPVLSPRPGTYQVASYLTVHLYDPTSGSTIYYTTDGATPTASSTKYTSAGIKLSRSETIKAMATAPNRLSSAVVTGSYTIK